MTSSKGSAPLGVHLTTLLSQTPVLAVPWQIPQAIPSRVATILERTHIKHIATTAPLDMNLARKERQQGRQNAKARRQVPNLEERKKRLAKVQAKETSAVPVFEKPRAIVRERMTLRSATAAMMPPAPTAATNVPPTRTSQTASPPTASNTTSGKPPAPQRRLSGLHRDSR
jgi:hypothetical protein